MKDNWDNALDSCKVTISLIFVLLLTLSQRQLPQDLVSRLVARDKKRSMY